MKKSLLLLIAILVVSLLPAGIVFAKSGGKKDKDHSSSAASDKDSDKPGKDEPWLDIKITTDEKDIIREYVKKFRIEEGKKKGVKVKSLPPGLQKKLARGGELPPGWQKKLIRGEVLDPVIFSALQILPVEILRRLPAQRPGVVLMAVDGKIVKLAEATRLILDVFDADGSD